MARLILIAVLAGLQLAFGAPDWLQPDGAPYLVRAMSYSFFHGNWWHLAVNSIAIWTIYQRQSKYSELLFSFLIAVAVYPLSFKSVIGFSNILYAQLGLRTPSLSSSWWKQPSVIVFLAVTILLVFIPRFSATTHVAAFVLGMAIAGVRRFRNNLLRDARRYL